MFVLRASLELKLFRVRRSCRSQRFKFTVLSCVGKRSSCSSSSFASPRLCLRLGAALEQQPDDEKESPAAANRRGFKGGQSRALAETSPLISKQTHDDEPYCSRRSFVRLAFMCFLPFYLSRRPTGRPTRLFFLSRDDDEARLASRTKGKWPRVN